MLQKPFHRSELSDTLAKLLAPTVMRRHHIRDPTGDRNKPHRWPRMRGHFREHNDANPTCVPNVVPSVAADLNLGSLGWVMASVNHQCHLNVPYACPRQPVVIRREPKPFGRIDRRIERTAPFPRLLRRFNLELLWAARLSGPILGRLEWAELSSSRTKATRDTCEGKRANSQSRRMMWGAPSLQTGVSTPRRRSRAVKGTGAIDVDRDYWGHYYKEL